MVLGWLRDGFGLRSAKRVLDERSESGESDASAVDSLIGHCEEDEEAAERLPSALPPQRARKASMKAAEAAEAATAAPTRTARGPVGLSSEERAAIPGLGSAVSDDVRKKYVKMGVPKFKVREDEADRRSQRAPCERTPSH